MTTGGKIARAGFFLFLGFWVLKGCLAGDPGPPTVILDHTKPWFVKARSPMCQSVADLNAF